MVTKENTKKAEEVGAQKAKDPSINWLAVSAWVLSSGAAMLVLLGYGVALAAETMFGVPHAAVFESAFELMDLASIAVLEIVPATFEVLTQWRFYAKLYGDLAAMLGTALLLWTFLAILAFYWRPKISQKPKSSTLKETLPPWKRGAKQYWLFNSLMVLCISVSPLLSLVAVFALVAVLVMLAIVPIIGMTAGTAHINKWVIEPERCMQLESVQDRRRRIGHTESADRKVVKVAQCVAVWKEQKVIARGRVVFYTSKAVLLLEESGRALRVPTADSVVEAVSDLSTPEVVK